VRLARLNDLGGGGGSGGGGGGDGGNGRDLRFDFFKQWGKSCESNLRSGKGEHNRGGSELHGMHARALNGGHAEEGESFRFRGERARARARAPTLVASHPARACLETFEAFHRSSSSSLSRNCAA